MLTQIFVQLPASVSAKAVSVELTSNYLSVTVGGEVYMKGDLYLPIKNDMSVWLVSTSSTHDPSLPGPVTLYGRGRRNVIYVRGSRVLNAQRHCCAVRYCIWRALWLLVPSAFSCADRIGRQTTVIYVQGSLRCALPHMACAPATRTVSVSGQVALGHQRTACCSA